MYRYCIVNVIFSVVINDADPDQTCYFDADPAPGLDSGLASNTVTVETLSNAHPVLVAARLPVPDSCTTRIHHFN
jgi:hypothetical protein